MATPDTDWDAASAGSISNGSEISFPEATGDWGTVTHFFLADAITGGNLLVYGEINSGSGKAIETNDQARFKIGDLTFTMD